jgi:hypothetical protein
MHKLHTSNWQAWLFMSVRSDKAVGKSSLPAQFENSASKVFELGFESTNFNHRVFTQIAQRADANLFSVALCMPVSL